MENFVFSRGFLPLISSIFVWYEHFLFCTCACSLGQDLNGPPLTLLFSSFELSILYLHLFLNPIGDSRVAEYDAFGRRVFSVDITGQLAHLSTAAFFFRAPTLFGRSSAGIQLSKVEVFGGPVSPSKLGSPLCVRRQTYCAVPAFSLPLTLRRAGLFGRRWISSGFAVELTAPQVPPRTLCYTYFSAAVTCWRISSMPAGVLYFSV